MKLALLIANRGFFPSSVVKVAREEMRQAAKRAGVELLEIDPSMTRYGAVETREDGEAFARFLASHNESYDGLIICLPNFGDENGIKEAIKDVRVPILLQAYPDEIGKLDFANRRDAFCGKLGLCSVLKQMGVTYVSGEPFVMHPLGEEFHRELMDFTSICRIVKGMRHLRIGMLGARTTAFKSVRFDEGALERLGAEVETLDLSDLFRRIREVKEGDPRLSEWENRIRNISDLGEMPEYAMENQCRLGIVMEELREEMKLDVAAIRCWSEMQYELQITPCTIMGILNGQILPCVCETDISNAPVMKALSLASCTGVGCLDINNNYGTDPDVCIMFHCGPLPADLLCGPGKMQEHMMFVKTQGENCSWGVNAGRIKPGEITVCGMRTENGKVRYFVEKAEVLDISLEEGFFGSYGVVRIPDLQRKLRYMSEEGFRHHAIITAGDQVRRIREALSKYLGYTEVRL